MLLPLFQVPVVAKVKKICWKNCRNAIKATTKDLAKQIEEKQKRMDDLEQYGRSNCLILHGCADLPKENADYVTFENFVLDTLNSRLKFAHPVHNGDINICHVLPS